MRTQATQTDVKKSVSQVQGPTAAKSQVQAQQHNSKVVTTSPRLQKKVGHIFVPSLTSDIVYDNVEIIILYQTPRNLEIKKIKMHFSSSRLVWFLKVFKQTASYLLLDI